MCIHSTMSKTYFIADLHLSQSRPDITHCLMDFLDHQLADADALYVLGDLFEYWLGDDHITPLSGQIEQAFRSLAERQIPVFFIHGNRDFLIRQAFANRAGITILPEQTVIDLHGTPTLIMHGDELCTRDLGYQKFRKKARGWWWPRLILSLPLFVRKKIAERGRKKSQQRQHQLSEEIMDVTPDEVTKTMARHQVKQLIHGHTHRPAIHKLEVDHQPAKRVVLGDWYEQGSVCVVDESGPKLQQLHFSG